jgi:hypothetical protein
MKDVLCVFCFDLPLFSFLQVDVARLKTQVGR